MSEAHNTLKRELRLPPIKGAVLIRSAEGRGVGTTLAGAADAKALTLEALARALGTPGPEDCPHA